MKSNEIQNQDMQKSLCYDYQLGQDCIATTMSADKTAKEYYDYIARTLGCEIPELANLLPNEAFVQHKACDPFPGMFCCREPGGKAYPDRKAGGRCGVFGKYEFNESE